MTDTVDILVTQAIDAIRASHEEAKRLIHAVIEEYKRDNEKIPDHLINLYCDVAMHIAEFEQTLQKMSNKK
jgi:hypothetical protein